LTNAHPPHVIVLTTFDADDMVLRALRAGASGFLLKGTPPPEIVRAIKLVAAGEAMLSPAITRRLIEHVADVEADTRRRRAVEAMGRLTSGSARSRWRSRGGARTRRSARSCS
jgi:DNA-binding NarL/FixJ family response regulator